jgi:hypothetical protein
MSEIDIKGVQFGNLTCRHWYIRVCVHFLDIPSGITHQMQAASYTDMEGSIVQLCLGNIPYTFLTQDILLTVFRTQ